MRKKQAFTLIELLVVIAILAILIAILLPVSFKALEMSKRSRCASNLRSLGAAFTSYATDHNGEMPHNKALPPPTGSFTEVTQFRIIITNVCQLGYVTDLSLWVCPSDTEDYQGKQVRPATDLAMDQRARGLAVFLRMRQNDSRRAVAAMQSLRRRRWTTPRCSSVLSKAPLNSNPRVGDHVPALAEGPDGALEQPGRLVGVRPAVERLESQGDA